jgi:hypothetical protein
VPLRRPQELTRMASDTSILLIANSRPFEVGKLYYYKVAGWRKLISSARTSVIVPKLRAWSDAAAPKLKSLEPALGPSTTNSAPESSFAVAALHAIETHASTIGAINVGFKAVESTIPAIEIVAARRPPTGGNLRDRWGSPVAEKRNSDDAKRDTQAAKAKRKRTRLKIVAPSAKAIAAAGVQDISAEVAKAETDIETEFAELITISESAIAELPEAIASGLRQGLKSLTVQHTRARKRRE